MGKYDALFLFGGSDKIFAELTRIVKERIKNRSLTDTGLSNLENYLGLKKGEIREITNDQKLIDKETFLSLKSILKISLQDALGQPDKLSDSELNEYWKKEYTSKPMKLVAFTGASTSTDFPTNPIDLNKYVILRAIGEFYRL